MQDELSAYSDSELADVMAQAVAASDWQEFSAAYVAAQDGFALTLAFRQIARMNRPPSPEFRRDFRNLYILRGESLRDVVNDDLVLTKALRILLALPHRLRTPVRLYRGEWAPNRRRRAYGPSWSRERGVADWFARKYVGVLLETEAPLEAIISVMPERVFIAGHDIKEREVVIDRYKLGPVRVLCRYDQKSVAGG